MTRARRTKRTAFTTRYIVTTTNPDTLCDEDECENDRLDNVTTFTRQSSALKYADQRSHNSNMGYFVVKVSAVARFDGKL